MLDNSKANAWELDTDILSIEVLRESSELSHTHHLRQTLQGPVMRNLRPKKGHVRLAAEVALGPPEPPRGYLNPGLIKVQRVKQ